MQAFQSVINEANRGNVSFYAVDVAGLTNREQNGRRRESEINSRSEVRMAQLGSTSDHVGPMTKELERNEDLLRLNPDSGLGPTCQRNGRISHHRLE